MNNYDSIQENCEPKFTNELNADMSSGRRHKLASSLAVNHA